MVFCGPNFAIPAIVSCPEAIQSGNQPRKSTNSNFAELFWHLPKKGTIFYAQKTQKKSKSKKEWYCENMEKYKYIPLN